MFATIPPDETASRIVWLTGPIQPAVDVVPDKLLHKTLHGSNFSNRTVITIAHRMNTIIQSDRVVVLEQGEVAECDTPAALIARKGLFCAFVKEAGLHTNRI
jgi:ATP-binding cassette, subfamily C (CFTR/MRP), member 1